ncbi:MULTISPECIES: helix-turn-helix domain-containing protein [Paenalcaligenes]|uniref:DNA binding HTH domain-containing protein n=1 Tax=Paenalcaligenes hermetiae TaxID=1157987 RepID=A0ABP9M3I6_9BURK|nr:helix-turn-helix domain-containing protein [Paenalcaligenes sp.]
MLRDLRAVLLLDEKSQWASLYEAKYKNICLEKRSFESLLDVDSQQQGTLHWADCLNQYDAIIVAASADNLSWLRSHLYYARPYLRCPVLAIVRNLHPLAIQDLSDVGALDFIMDYSVPIELPIRVKILVQRARQSMAVKYTSSDQNFDHLPQPVLQDASAPIEQYVATMNEQFGLQHHSFQQAKKMLVQCFEKEYICAALMQNQGNITRAARAAQKHRRSFWELMRKHNINAEKFRVSACPDQPLIH